MIQFKNLVGAIGLEPTTPPCQGDGQRRNALTDNELNQPMTRVYDMRVLEKGALHMWTGATLYLMAPSLHGVFLTAEWRNGTHEHLWRLSFAERTVYSSRDLDDAALARDEWKSMIDAARLLAGVGRAQV